ncbi:MAG: hypothetical protein PWP65_1775 [Clostridia bacterium]|nr:hypothetical protein [Clostridia bacterium]
MPYKTEQWYVSPWNYAEEVTKQFNFPPKIEFHDVSLRDGEQQAGVIFTKEDKIRIAEKLAEAGVHRIEAGMPAVSKDDELAIKEIVKRNLGPKIFAFCRCMIEDVKRALDCGVEGIVIEIPSSDHMIQYAYGWPLQKAIDLSIEATSFAKENGLYTVFFPIDASRAEINWFLDLIVKVATEGHMDALAVVDTFGGLAPTTIPYLIKKIKERIDKPLEAHFHDDFGCAAANTMIALASGCEVAHTTVTAIGERAGNAPYEEIALGLLTMYGVDTGIKTEKMYEIAKLVQELARVTVRPNRPIVGDRLFHVESGIIAGWIKNAFPDHKLEVTPFLPSLVGQKGPEVVLGKSSGSPSVEIWLEKLGLKATPEQIMEMVNKIKEKALKTKELLTEEDFRAIYEEVVG